MPVSQAISSLRTDEPVLSQATTIFPQFRLVASAEELALWAGIPEKKLPPLHIANDDRFPLVHPVLHVCGQNARLILSPMRLGLIPSYAHDDHHAADMTEAHAECMTSSAGFRSAFKRRRCLIPATAFHEFKDLQGPSAPPSSFSLISNSIFAIAGVWESWCDDRGEAVDSFAMINVHPGVELGSHFDRMPVLIAPSEQDRWLHADSLLPLDLLKPLSSEDLKDWQMSPYFVLPSLRAGSVI